MPQGVGRALERMVKHKEPEKREEKRDVSLLMNSSRRSLFEYLCLHPCSHLSEISGALSVSTNTARWHLRKLIEGELVSMRESRGRMLYYPFGFISTDDVKIFEFLSEISMRELYIHLVDHPGSTQSDLAKAVGMSNQATIRATKKMEGLDLINRIQDGVYARYFPTDLLLKKREEYASRMKTFQESILRRLRSEGLKPQVIRREEGMILIRLTLGSKKGVLNISTDPYTSALAT